MWGNLPEEIKPEPEQTTLPQPNPEPETEVAPLSECEKHLFTSVKDTLENMVFSPVEDIDIIFAKIGIITPLQGCLTIIISEQLSKNIASSMYAMDPDELTSEMVLDTVAELANTISGQFIELIIPEEETFELTVPETGKAKTFHFSEKAFVWPFTTSGEMFTIGIEGEAILEKLSLKP